MLSGGYSSGYVFQLIGIFAGILAICAYIYYLVTKDSRVYKFAGSLIILQAVSATICVLLLLYSLATNDFRLIYVANYTDSTLPMVYKLCALWGGQAGSLLFWAWLAAVFIAVELLRVRKGDKKYNSYMLLMGLVNATFFLFLCTAVDKMNPFELYAFTPREGGGMNPMLQNPGMVIHPPLLYIGFVGFIIPFAHAFASCCTKDTSTTWLTTSRPWTLFTWVFLTAGIVLGAWWAYVELGWGGYWAWDPVENASLFPWITSTAFLHAAIIYERKHRLKSWSYVLILVTFQLTIFGTYLTRSGIMTDSVHSFGLSPIGNFFLGFILVTSCIFLVSLFMNRNQLKDQADFNFLSREGIFFVAVLCFVALTLALMFYTMLPVITQNLLSDKKSVEIMSYNLVSIPFFIAIFLMAGLAPFMSYGQMEPKDLLKKYFPAGAAGLAVTFVAFVMGYRSIASLLLTFTATTVFIAFVILLYKMLKGGGISAIWKNRRLTGAVIIHIGLAMVAYGVIYSAFFSEKYFTERIRSNKVEVDERWIGSYNESFQFRNWTIQVGELEHADGANYHSDFVPITVLEGDKELVTLYPELRKYYKWQKDNYFAEVAYYSMLKGDLYVIFNGADENNRMLSISVIFQPLIIWIWIGSIVMCIGGLVAMLHRTRRKVE